MIELNKFNSIARVYDTLGWLVFGRSLLRSQLCFIEQIPSQAKVLILGGGSGKFLSLLNKAKPDCKVWYIEASSAMIALSKQKSHNNHNVCYIHGTENNIPAGLSFDVIITHFYLDLFVLPKLESLIRLITSKCSTPALWIVSDFVPTNVLWHRFLLKVMFIFFRTLVKIEPHQLENWDLILKRNGFQLLQQLSFYHGFIKSRIYVLR